MLLNSLTVSLEDQGYQVLTAMDGHTALEQAVGQRPDLVLLDLMLPGTGRDAGVPRAAAGQRIPIIMLTAREDVER